MTFRELCIFWDLEIGDPPSDPNAFPTLGNWVRVFGAVVVQRAIERVGADERIETSDDAWEAVRLTIADWKSRGQIKAVR